WRGRRRRRRRRRRWWRRRRRRWWWRRRRWRRRRWWWRRLRRHRDGRRVGERAVRQSRDDAEAPRRLSRGEQAAARDRAAGGRIGDRHADRVAGIPHAPRGELLRAASAKGDRGGAKDDLRYAALADAGRAGEMRARERRRDGCVRSGGVGGVHALRR